MIDLVGYRRFGHNEQDEAAYTQPLMVEQIDRHPTVRELYAAKLVEAGVLGAEEAESLAAEALEKLREAHERLKASFGQDVPPKSRDEGVPRRVAPAPIDTRVPADLLRELNEELLRVPDGFTVHPKLARQLERRREALDSGEIDWGQAESLAFASLLVDGVPIRLTGQDTERGTFSHRHLVLHDAHDRRARDADPGARRGQRVVRGLQLAAVGVRVRRLRVRLLGRGARGARALGGAVRRLRERRADDHRPVHLERPRQVEADLTPDAAAPARLRGQRPGALERAARALPPARGPGEHPHRELHDGRAVLPPPAAPGARPERAAARRDDAEGAAAPEGRGVDARRARRRRASSR